MKPISKVHYPITLEKGISLIEVLVALLILAVAALGYSALQIRSLNSVDESMMRMQAQLILKEAAERIRSNANLDEVMTKYQIEFTSNALPAITECAALLTCSSTQIIRNDVAALQLHAKSKGIKLGMVTCPQTELIADTKCLVAAWNETLPSYGANVQSTSVTYPDSELLDEQHAKTATKEVGCMKSDGSYFKTADCVYLEAY